MKWALRTLGSCLLSALPALAQTAASPDAAQRSVSPPPAGVAQTFDKRAVAVRIPGAIVVDGRLDERAWELAIPATGFVQRFPSPGAPASEPTEVRIVYDEGHLYVGIICFDSQVDGIVTNDLSNDFDFRGSDNVEISIDSLNGRRSAFYFRTNPAGAKADAQISDERFNFDWDGVWDVRATTNSEGWVAEFVIPFKTLRFSETSTSEWGLNFGRKVLRLNEDTFWFYPSIPIRYNMGRVSLYGTLEGLEQIRQGRNLKVTPFATAGATQLRAPTGATGALATDGRYDGGLDVKYSLTPSLTLDATYRTDFAQVEVDQQQVNLTRFSVVFPEKRDFFLENSGTFRFGSGDNLIPFFSRRIGLGAAGTPIPIVGGGRVSGRAGRYEVGVLGMSTESEGATPSNRYLVGRVKRHLFTNSWIGGLATSRDSTVAGDFNRVYGADVHLQFYERLVFDSHLLRSETPGRRGQDYARQLELGWHEEELTVAAGYNEIQPQFNPEVGLLRRGDHTRYDGTLSWLPRIDGSDVIRNLVLGTDVEYFESATTKQIETRTQRVNAGVAFENNGSVTFAITDTFDRLVEPFQIRPALAIGADDYRYLGYSASGTSNPGRKIGGSGTVEWGEFWDGTRQSYRGTLNVRPRYDVIVNTSFQRDEVALPNGRFTSNLIGARLEYSFTPRALLAGFFQYNSSTRQVSSNVRFNLIHRPLSDVFLIYNDLRDATGRSVQRAFVLKVTNLLDF